MVLSEGGGTSLTLPVFGGQKGDKRPWIDGFNGCQETPSISMSPCSSTMYTGFLSRLYPKHCDACRKGDVSSAGENPWIAGGSPDILEIIGPFGRHWTAHLGPRRHLPVLSQRVGPILSEAGCFPSRPAEGL